MFDLKTCCACAEIATLLNMSSEATVMRVQRCGRNLGMVPYVVEAGEVDLVLGV